MSLLTMPGTIGALFRSRRPPLGGVLQGGRSATLDGPQTYAADAGRWVTIGGRKGEGGKRSGGSPVFIQGGRITKGHPSLVGKKPGEIKSGDAEHGSHRKQLSQGREYDRATWRRKAREAGHDPKHLDELAE